ncbi:transforming growth factor-beta receptor-associated protein 1 [Hydra vulgaris]|uniref:Transforming growth factor-beta receptor-associated protein 1 n=1 Tax=Hydra vulgaris TaxID=6087 RepID=T2M918_HYDVU|nr:transforming growth factor-beta receptor-associated protein 1 [Hydra vulgaris]
MSFKAFEVTNVIEQSNFGDKVKGTISCLDVSTNNLYIGTSDCFLSHFAFEKGISPSNKATFISKLQRHKHLGFQKPIKQLIACFPACQLLVLCESKVYAVSMIGLEFRNNSNKEIFKGITVMAKNKNPQSFNPDETQLCLGTKKKTIQVVTFSKDKIFVLKEVNLPGIPLTLSIDAQTVCTVLDNQYYLVNYIKYAIQELFIFEKGHVLPLVKCIGFQEFLLNGPTDTMGMIVTADGLSLHQPLTWSESILSVACSYPYILVLGNSTVTIHNLIDQKQKQTMLFTGGVFINDYNGDVYIATQKSVMAFIAVPLSKQIQLLVDNKRVEEAFDLLQVARKLKQCPPNFDKQIQIQAAFIYFLENNFEKAYKLFVESFMDPRELIVLYPDIMPRNSTYIPSKPSYHSIPDIMFVVKNSQTALKESKLLLLKYLEVIRKHHSDLSFEIDTALAKIYIEFDHPSLFEFLSKENNAFVEETLSWLQKYNQFQCMAFYFVYLKQPQKAMDIWNKLQSNKLHDDKYTGMSCIIDYLLSVDNTELIWNNIKWLLDNNETLAVKVFINRDIFSHVQVFNFLHKFPIALQVYLEYLVIDKKIDEEVFHTHLAGMYIDHVLKLLNENNQINEINHERKRLQSLLETSSKYKISTLLNKISEYPLYHESAILYGKLGQHDKAMKILVYKLKDFVAAERYCDIISVNKDNIFKQHLFHMLLNVYLNPVENEDGVRAEHLVEPTIQLLNKRRAEFNSVSVLKILPEDWSVGLIQPFLSGTLREMLWKERKSKIESRLCSLHYLKTKFSNISLQSGYFKMTEDSCCDFCLRPYTEPILVCYPNKKGFHPHCCKDKYICPATKINFK